jgi:addiction module RelE/StbE family toxin
VKLIWLDEALKDLEATFDYIADKDFAAAQRLHTAIHACAERLPEHPFMYRPGRIPGTREAVAHPNYILIYRVTVETVEIVSLVHSRQQYP